jgi:hypothetical protein
MTMHRKINRSVRLAVRQRLIMILTEEIQSYEGWLERIAPKLKATRRAQVRRVFKKRIQALRIVVYILTPRDIRDTDMPNLFERD